jgi:Dyp-type peroxidase family
MTSPTAINLDLEEIQGNILAGFSKDFQAFLFLEFTDPARARTWPTGVAGDVATCKEVASFNQLFKDVRSRHNREGPVKSTWMNLALSYSGLAQLDIADDELAQFPEEFRLGMAARAAVIGDTDDGAPDEWIAPFGSPTVHAVMLIAADTVADRDHEVTVQLDRLAGHGIALLFIQEGMTREDQPGHEHFGFKDGISQPGIRGFTPPNNPADPNQGDPGQDLLFPGEFVLGYPTQDPNQDGDNVLEVPGPDSSNGPPWARNGSYLVFRRLRQDVAGFRDFVAQQAKLENLGVDVIGAKLVGRYMTGAPLEQIEDLSAVDTTAGDPSVAHPEVLQDAHINNFEYGDGSNPIDVDGRRVPRAAHIRKAYPRDQVPPGEAQTQTHRLLRRRIPFGASFDAGAAPGSPAAGDASFPNDRGLLFLCYQRSIADQFEFVQNRWVNNPDFPQANDGHDPIISQKDGTRQFTLPGGLQEHIQLMQRWVTTTGGEYFFQPSVGGLRQIAQAVEYVVQPYDTLSAIAERFYGDASQWPRIFAANRGQISDPNVIYPGQVLHIPQ